MFALILEADLVICDITVHNANVFYELGVRHALRKKHTVLIKGEPSADITPFDLSTDRYLKYPVTNPAAALDALVATLQSEPAQQPRNRQPDLPDAADTGRGRPGRGDGVAAGLHRGGRARRGRLRQGLAARDRRRPTGPAFPVGRPAVRGACAVEPEGPGRRAGQWETLRNANDDDIEANLALANIYERQYRDRARDAAGNRRTRPFAKCRRRAQHTAQRAEALALKGEISRRVAYPNGRCADPAAARQQALDARALRVLRVVS